MEVVTVDSPTAPWVKDFPIPIYALGPSHFSYGYAPRLKPWLKAHRREFDIVVVNGLWKYGGFCIWDVLHNSTTPYCVFPHGMLDPWFKRHYPLKHMKKWLYWPWAEYRVLRDALAVFFTCEEERRLARRTFWLYKCDEIVMNYGTAAPQGDTEGQRQLFLKAFPQLGGKRCFLFLGRFHEKKGAGILMTAFHNFLRDTSDPEAQEIRLVMAGPDEPENSHLRHLRQLAGKLGIAEKVVWTGMLSGEIKWGAFRNAEVFVLPSHQENFGIAVAEALSCGVPVLISNKVNIWREISMHGAGLVESDDAAGTELLLHRWCDLSAEDKSIMRKDARACFQKRFEIKASGNTFIESLRLLGLRP